MKVVKTRKRIRSKYIPPVVLAMGSLVFFVYPFSWFEHSHKVFGLKDGCIWDFLVIASTNSLTALSNSWLVFLLALVGGVLAGLLSWRYDGMVEA